MAKEIYCKWRSCEYGWRSIKWSVLVFARFLNRKY